jgi:hypothetical protein
MRDDRVLSYYLDRPTSFGIDTPARLDSAARASATPYVVIVPERLASRYPDLVAQLRAGYSERRAQELMIFLPKR